jgi:hypothetical protein
MRLKPRTTKAPAPRAHDSKAACEKLIERILAATDAGLASGHVSTLDAATLRAARADIKSNATALFRILAAAERSAGAPSGSFFDMMGPLLGGAFAIGKHGVVTDGGEKHFRLERASAMRAAKRARTKAARIKLERAIIDARARCKARGNASIKTVAAALAKSHIRTSDRTIRRVLANAGLARTRKKS